MKEGGCLWECFSKRKEWKCKVPKVEICWVTSRNSRRTGARATEFGGEGLVTTELVNEQTLLCLYTPMKACFLSVCQ